MNYRPNFSSTGTMNNTGNQGMNSGGNQFPRAYPQAMIVVTSSPSILSHDTQNTGGATNVAPWVFDTGATSHVTHDVQNIQSLASTPSSDSVMVGNGQSLPVTNSGHSNQSDSTQGSMQAGAISYPYFY
ncbi:hypothetical protein Acr_00g0026430 [Actinidia rufa]|uniref:Retrovirus-related Pol polyprotein from transposon TNT 1-94-like beta-barrel domain-containing protein n=1 Tax=Actinidia rufa TaxID=165716 RepID=A0A7J0DFJ6_9ERIC|nr:hypothetical protein Acr_00g0026430 [Actinidia rufa]